MDWHEVAIVGGGPVGIELGVALRRAGISYVQFEAKQVGATMGWWPLGTRWFSSNERIAIAGVPLMTVDQNKATREEYLTYLRSVVKQFELDVRTYEPVTDVRRIDGGFEVHTRPLAGEKVYRARRVVLATGGTAMPRMLNVPGEDLPHVSHYMHEPHDYFGKRVLVVGGRNSAVEAALRIQQVGAQVTMSYRRSEFDAKSIKYWLYPEIMGLIRNRKIRAHFNTVVTRITPESVRLARCEAAGDGAMAVTDQTFEVPADFVLAMVGYKADMTLAKRVGVELSAAGEVPAFDPQTMETNVPGVYMAGTAVAGTQERYKVFLENCHVHVDRIVAAITGAPTPADPEPVLVPES